LLLWIPAACFALKSDSHQPMRLEADNVEIDEASGVSLYQGNVVITQGSLKIWADKMWIHRRNGKTEKIVTEGAPTHFRQLMDDDGKEVKGQARRMEVYPGRNQIVLIQDAMLQQEKDRFYNDRIVYDRERALVKAGTSAQGKQRVRVTIAPKTGEK